VDRDPVAQAKLGLRGVRDRRGRQQEDRGQRGGDGTAADHPSSSHHHQRRLLVADIISSAAEITRAFISQAPWAAISSEIPDTASTLDCPRTAWCSDPAPSAPGLPVVGAPLAGVSTNRLSPIASRPVLLAKRASSSRPISCGTGSLSSVTWTCPSGLTVISRALSGMVI